MTHLTHRIPAGAKLAWRRAVTPGTRTGENYIVHGFSQHGRFFPLDGQEHKYIDAVGHPYLCPATSPAYDCGTAGEFAPGDRVFHETLGAYGAWCSFDPKDPSGEYSVVVLDGGRVLRCPTDQITAAAEVQDRDCP